MDKPTATLSLLSDHVTGHDRQLLAAGLEHPPRKASPAVQHKVQAIHPSRQVVHMEASKAPWGGATCTQWQEAVGGCRAQKCRRHPAAHPPRAGLPCKRQSPLPSASQLEQHTCAKVISSRCPEAVVFVSPTTLHTGMEQGAGRRAMSCEPKDPQAEAVASTTCRGAVLHAHAPYLCSLPTLKR